MDLGTVLSVAQTLFAALQCPELRQLSSFFGVGFKSQLEELQETVSTVKAVLQDAEIKQDQLSSEAKLWIQKLKNAVYDADDLFDEFVTLVKQKQLIKGEKFSKNVSLFFSRYNPIKLAHSMSQEVKNIRRKLDATAKDHSQFGFSIDPQPIRRRREETCSYIHEGNIIGREDDVEKLIGHLLNYSTVQQDVSFLSVVGIGGLGKTALTQLVYNDPRVASAFPLKLWTCVSDHDQEQLDVEGILHKILTSAGEKHEGSNKELLQRKLREKLTSNKYLLVLDDVWTENRNHWLKLVEFLLGGQRGSWVVVTTRSHKTAQIVGGSPTHELQGLSKKNSWSLFKKVALGSEHLSPDDDLLKIGREIVEKCASVPLAIRVAGSLLYGQDKSRWISFQKIGLFNSRECQKDIMPVLMFSYHQLELPLKSCFTYCALFPKDTVIEKELLISLWLAQGYVVPLDDGQRLEDAAEEYFTILMRRCFFQDVEHDKYGDISSCKIHDLMHDIAQNVAGKEICFKTSVTHNMDREVRHISHVRSKSLPYSFSKTDIRSFLDVGAWHDRVLIDRSSLKALVVNWMCLRVLDLSNSGIKSLPCSIGGLLHLRYLDLSDNRELDVLPQSITKLYNLQTLKLCECRRLKELPKDLMKLVNLRILEINECDSLTNMPKGLSKLTCLRVLSVFLVDGSKASQKQWFDQLGELKRLNCLKGELSVKIRLFEIASTEVKEDIDREGAYLRAKEHLKHIRIHFDGMGIDEEARRLMEELQPHPNLKELELFNCVGMRMPSWARENKLASSLPNLTRLRFSRCEMEDLTCLGDLHHLADLDVRYCSNLKYIIEKSALAGGSDPNGFFPYLRDLVMEDLPALQGWTNLGKGVGNNNQLCLDINSSFSMAPIPLPQLKFFTIWNCPNLRSILICPNLVELNFHMFNKGLQIIAQIAKLGDKNADSSGSSARSSTPLPSSSSSNGISKFRKVRLDDVLWLNSFPREVIQCLDELCISVNDELESLKEAGDVFSSCSSSLRSLGIHCCRKLRSVISGGLEHLTALEALSIYDCPNVNLLGEEGMNTIGMPWPSFPHSLCNLLLKTLPQLVDLPNWMQSLAALHTLEIHSCSQLESMPDWMPKLTSLRMLVLYDCSERLKERCQQPSGEDWPHIQHISSIIY